MPVLLQNRCPALPESSRRPVRAALAIALAAIGMAGAGSALASSHREAPFITTAPKVDGTDFYMFQSYESGRSAYTTLIADYEPLQDPYGGPNYFSLDPNALYEIHVDNTGDGKEDITFQFRFKNTLKDLSLPIAGANVAIPLVTTVGSVAAGDSSRINVNESFTLDIVRGDRRGGRRDAVTNAADGSKTFTKPLDYVGDKTFGSDAAYAKYAGQYVYSINIPGCAAGPGRVFVGQRKDPFVVALGQAFDQFNLNPVGSPTANPDKLAYKNVTALELEIPTACLVANGDPVIGGWTTASLRQGRLLNPTPSGNNRAELTGGAWTQVSRLGMPLVNELVIGLKDKDRFNASRPQNDGQFATYVTNPTLPTILQALFNVPAPTSTPRADIVATFLTGIKGVNQPKSVTPAEMLRLNTSIAPKPADQQRSLGVLASDSAGFPNGRRPGDDVVDATLRVAMGVLCTLDAPSVFGCKAGDAKAGGLPYTDGAEVNAGFFDTGFPYLKAPLAGAKAN
ncbi:DUF4331 domain-containing protein [Derxia lacustris]|uniref:DUF4331 domain-containing protein n=1 Tax=Derxia lacustris TaxID=764842 RepID=UPI000A173FF7|nr:DUF4331 domain-containing protein [Derxia lacustris]